jgi:hypothetical protein
MKEDEVEILKWCFVIGWKEGLLCRQSQTSGCPRRDFNCSKKIFSQNLTEFRSKRRNERDKKIERKKIERKTDTLSEVSKAKKDHEVITQTEKPTKWRQEREDGKETYKNWRTKLD